VAPGTVMGARDACRHCAEAVDHPESKTDHRAHGEYRGTVEEVQVQQSAQQLHGRSLERQRQRSHVLRQGGLRRRAPCSGGRD
jgi:hypothetical protein